MREVGIVGSSCSECHESYSTIMSPPLRRDPLMKTEDVAFLLAFLRDDSMTLSYVTFLSIIPLIYIKWDLNKRHTKCQSCCYHKDFARIKWNPGLKMLAKLLSTTELACLSYTGVPAARLESHNIKYKI